MSGPATTTPSAAIAPATGMGAVSLTVADLAGARTFYVTAIGLEGRDLGDGAVGLGVPGGRELVRLHGDAAATPPDPRATGLFHLAILMPSRAELARSLVRLARAGWALDGVADHLVSEALYLSDPEGNGIELYRDRPRQEWQRDGDQIRMATLALDLHDLMSELGPEPHAPERVAAGTIMGHVHLQVNDLAAAERFYHGILGFDVTTRGYPGALFVSAGGYHHHLGLNTWRSAGSDPPPPGSTGLRAYEIELPDRAELERVLARLQSAGTAPVPEGDDGAVGVRDPAGNRVILRVR